MKKVKAMLILTAFIGLLSCGGNSADDLKKDEKLEKNSELEKNEGNNAEM